MTALTDNGFEVRRATVADCRAETKGVLRIAAELGMIAHTTDQPTPPKEKVRIRKSKATPAVEGVVGFGPHEGSDGNADR